MPSLLDETDLALLAALQADGRASNKELANIAGLAPSTTHGRLKRLAETGVLRGVHADVDPEALGIGLQALIFLRLASHDRETVMHTWDQLCARPEVRSAYYIGGDDDLIVHVMARDARHLRDFVIDGIGQLDGIGRVRTELLFQQHHGEVLPTYPA
jgi:DNA-binding Lrp family transcriptional regulator